MRISKEQLRNDIINYRNAKVKNMAKNNPEKIVIIKKMVEKFGLLPDWKEEQKQYLKKSKKL